MHTSEQAGLVLKYLMPGTKILTIFKDLMGKGKEYFDHYSKEAAAFNNVRPLIEP
jgi:hypothetical protein